MEYKNCAMNGCAYVDAEKRACVGCGFDMREAARRRAMLKQRGLTRDPGTGLRQLVVKRGKRR